MEKRSGLAGMGITVNAPYLGAWPEKVGQFILNFGGIELISYQTLLLLEASEPAFLKNIDQLFSKRVDRLVELLETTDQLTEEERGNAIALWKEARDIARWRNRIAHNPVLPTWKPGSDAERQPPDLLGIPDLRQLKKSAISDSIPIELLDRMINDLVGLAQRLHQIASSIGMKHAAASDGEA
jgi:hypothetical protein